MVYLTSTTGLQDELNWLSSIFVWYITTAGRSSSMWIENFKRKVKADEQRKWKVEWWHDWPLWRCCPPCIQGALVKLEIFFTYSRDMTASMTYPIISHVYTRNMEQSKVRISFNANNNSIIPFPPSLPSRMSVDSGLTSIGILHASGL